MAENKCKPPWREEPVPPKSMPSWRTKRICHVRLGVEAVAQAPGEKTPVEAAAAETGATARQLESTPKRLERLAKVKALAEKESLKARIIAFRRALTAKNKEKKEKKEREAADKKASKERKSMRDVMRKAGWRLRKRIKEPQDRVTPCKKEREPSGAGDKDHDDHDYSFFL